MASAALHRTRSIAVLPGRYVDPSSDEVVISYSALIVQYLRTWFLIDLFAVIPLEAFIADELSQWEAEAAANPDAVPTLRAAVARRSAELGFYQMTQPRSVGGSEASQLELLVMQETLARANLEHVSGAVFGRTVEDGLQGKKKTRGVGGRQPPG